MFACIRKQCIIVQGFDACLCVVRVALNPYKMVGNSTPRAILQKALYIARKPKSIIAITLFAVCLGVIPLVFHTDEHISIADGDQSTVKDITTGSFFQFVSFGALMCCIPLVFDAYLDMRITKSLTFSAIQWLLLVSIIFPCATLLIVIYLGDGSVIMFSYCAFFQEILFVGAMLAFHAICTDRRNHSLKYVICIVNFMYAVGSLLIAYYNMGVGNEASNSSGLFLIGCGLLGIFLILGYHIYQLRFMLQCLLICLCCARTCCIFLLLPVTSYFVQ